MEYSEREIQKSRSYEESSILIDKSAGLNNSSKPWHMTCTTWQASWASRVAHRRSNTIRFHVLFNQPIRKTRHSCYTRSFCVRVCSWYAYQRRVLLNELAIVENCPRQGLSKVNHADWAVERWQLATDTAEKETHEWTRECKGIERLSLR